MPSFPAQPVPVEFPGSHETLPREDHDQDEDDGEDDHPHAGDSGDVDEPEIHGLLDEPQRLAAPGEEDGRDDGPGGAAKPPCHDDDQQVEGQEEGEEGRRDRGDQVGQQPAAHPLEEAARREGEHLVPVGVDSHGLGGRLVELDGLHGHAVAAADHPDDEEYRDDRETPGPPDVRVAGDALEPEGPVGDGLGVVGDDADHLAEPQGDDGQVVPARAEDGEPHQESEQGRHDARRDERDDEGERDHGEGPDAGLDDEGDLLLHRREGQQGRGIGADRHEGVWRQRELARHSVDEVVAHGEDDEDGDVVEDADRVVGAVRVDDVKQRQEHDRARDGEELVSKMIRLHVKGSIPSVLVCSVMSSNAHLSVVMEESEASKCLK